LPTAQNLTFVFGVFVLFANFILFIFFIRIRVSMWDILRCALLLLLFLLGCELLA